MNLENLISKRAPLIADIEVIAKRVEAEKKEYLGEPKCFNFPRNLQVFAD